MTPPPADSSGRRGRDDRPGASRCPSSSRGGPSSRGGSSSRGSSSRGDGGGRRDGRGRGRGGPGDERVRGSFGKGDRSRDGRSERPRGPRVDEPDLPADVTSKDLDRYVLRQLSGLPPHDTETVARHLVLAGRLVDEDAELAYRHARAARGRAARVGVVREAVGETAYACGRFAEALSELRAARRITGSWDYLPMMADCERALKRPERAVALSQESAVGALDQAGQVEILIVAAGARRDMGQLEAAVQLLETGPVGSKSRQPWVARLRYAYADALQAIGRRDDAVTWFHRTVAVDVHAATDAEDRLAALGSALDVD